MLLIKDCAVSCAGSACNTDLDEAARKFSNFENPQDTCYACSYTEMDDGSLLGNKFCGEEPDKVTDAAITCPMYANSGCYTGTNAHYVSHCQIECIALIN